MQFYHVKNERERRLTSSRRNVGIKDLNFPEFLEAESRNPHRITSKTKKELGLQHLFRFGSTPPCKVWVYLFQRMQRNYVIRIRFYHGLQLTARFLKNVYLDWKRSTTMVSKKFFSLHAKNTY